MNKQILITTIAALLVIATAVIVWAAGETMPRSVIPGGGGTGLQNGDYILHGALGQPVAGSVENSEYQLCSGFWCGGPVTRTVYLPLVLRSYPLIHELGDAPDTCPGYGPLQFYPPHLYRENFDHQYDEDWYTFEAIGGTDYTINTSGLESRADTVLYLYDIDCSTMLVDNDDCVADHPELGSCIDWQAPSNGTYHLMVRNYDWHIYYGANTGYTLGITKNP
jgi:hypothetical protein